MRGTYTSFRHPRGEDEGGVGLLALWGQVSLDQDQLFGCDVQRGLWLLGSHN
jgi:hypothetical protein